jgi:anion-transporting  ArsA/GET3 family ATPase
LQGHQAGVDNGNQQSFTARPYVFVSGKGGVGKSLVAAALAAGAAESGRRTLLVETGDRSYFRDFLELSQVDHVPRPSGLGFDLAIWSGESCLREYVLHLLKLERIYKIFFENKVMKALVNVAPGLGEIAILGKITSGVRRVGPPMNYDTIIVDMPATGHALAMFRTPKGMAEAIQIGPIAQHSGEIDRLLRDPAISGLVVVTLFEELPIAETEEFVKAVTKEFNMPVQVIANRQLDLPLTENELSAISQLGDTELSKYAGGLASQLKNQNMMMIQLNEMQARETLQRPVKCVPRFLSLSPREMVQAAKGALRDLWMRS